MIQWFNSPFCKAAYRYLPIFIFWNIWILRNKCIFENWKPAIPALIFRIEGLLNTYPAPTKSYKIRKIGPKPVLTFPCGFFDGAAADNISGSGFVIYLNEQHYFCFSIGSGLGTNTRAELLASWAVLRVSQMMGIPIQLIFGDSLVIISWLNRSSALDVPSLMHWCKDIRNLLLLAPQVIFKHIFREHNSLAYGLSKKALNLDLGHGFFSEFLDGKVINEGHFVLF